MENGFRPRGLLLHALVCQSHARDQEPPPLPKPRWMRWSQAHLEILSHFSMQYLAISFWMIFSGFQVLFFILSHWMCEALVFGSFQLANVFSTKQTSVDVFNIIFRIPTKHWKINDFSQSSKISSP
jgi:hypothetical protein